MFFFMTFAAHSGAVCTKIETYEFLCFYWHDKRIMINGISKNSFLMFEIVVCDIYFKAHTFHWGIDSRFANIFQSISVSIIYILYLNRKVIMINQMFDWVLWIYLYTYLSLVFMSVDCQMFWMGEKIEENVKIWKK